MVYKFESFGELHDVGCVGNILKDALCKRPLVEKELKKRIIVQKQVLFSVSSLNIACCVLKIYLQHPE